MKQLGINHGPMVAGDMHIHANNATCPRECLERLALVCPAAALIFDSSLTILSINGHFWHECGHSLLDLVGQKRQEQFYNARELLVNAIQCVNNVAHCTFELERTNGDIYQCGIAPVVAGELLFMLFAAKLDRPPVRVGAGRQLSLDDWIESEAAIQVKP